MKKKADLDKIRNQRIVASIFLIFAVLTLMCGLSIPFIENFSDEEIAFAGFGVFILGIGLWFLLNPYRRPKIDAKHMFRSEFSGGNILGIIGREDEFSKYFQESNPLINFIIGSLVVLFGVALIVFTIYSVYYL